MFVSLGLGLLHAWVGRYSMNVDGMSYLDVGESFFRRDWAHAINAYWSPLYPWTLGIVVGLMKPSAKWEFPVVHLINFGIFVAALFAFRFLLHTVLGFGREQTSEATARDGGGLPEWALVMLAYGIFWWTALEVETLYEVTPDLGVMACICLTAGMLLRLRQEEKLWKFALFGVILTVGYWTKAILFPIGLVTLGTAYFWRRARPGWGKGMAVASLVFLCACAPLIFLLSQQKGRFTFGDSGKMNYAWSLTGGTFTRNWQGGTFGGGSPVHPTRQLLLHPPLFEFAGPVAGTYPPWTDPSYWNEGLQWHFKLRPQIAVLAKTVPSEIRLLFRARPELVAGIIALALISGQLYLSGLLELWPFLAISIAGMGIYLPVHEEDRFLGGAVLVLFLMLITAVRLRPDVQRSGVYVAVAVVLVMALGTADYTVRVGMNHMTIPGTGSESAWQDVIVAEQLRRMGAAPGDKVAVIANGTGAFWAHLAKLRIVAEIMDGDRGAQEFWGAPGEVRQQVFDTFERVGAKRVVTSCPGESITQASWERIGATPYCVHGLRPSK